MPTGPQSSEAPLVSVLVQADCAVTGPTPAFVCDASISPSFPDP